MLSSAHSLSASFSSSKTSALLCQWAPIHSLPASTTASTNSRWIANTAPSRLHREKERNLMIKGDVSACVRVRLHGASAQSVALSGAAIISDAAACRIGVKSKDKNKKNLLMMAPCLKPRRRHFRSPLSAATLDCNFRLPIQAVTSSWR